MTVIVACRAADGTLVFGSDLIDSIESVCQDAEVQAVI